MDRTTDRAVMALLLGGVALATATALYLPALHVRSADRALLGLSSWQVVPVTTLLLFAALAAALAVHWVPRWRHLRLPVTVAAIVMLFVPPLAALAAGVSPGTEARALLVRHSGNAAPWVDPGWGTLVLLAAGSLIGLGLWREEHPAGAAETPLH